MALPVPRKLRHQGEPPCSLSKRLIQPLGLEARQTHIAFSKQCGAENANCRKQKSIHLCADFADHNH